MKTIEIKSYVTAKGGVVVLNGPFPLDKAEAVRALCDESPELLACLKDLMAWVYGEEAMPEGLEDRVNASIARAERRA